MDEQEDVAYRQLEDAVCGLLAIIGSERKLWAWLDTLLSVHRPKPVGKKQRKRRGIEDFYVKFKALQEYDDAPRGKKEAAEAAVYAKHGRKVSRPLADKNRLRV